MPERDACNGVLLVVLATIFRLLRKSRVKAFQSPDRRDDSNAIGSSYSGLVWHFEESSKDTLINSHNRS